MGLLRAFGPERDLRGVSRRSRELEASGVCVPEMRLRVPAAGTGGRSGAEIWCHIGIGPPPGARPSTTGPGGSGNPRRVSNLPIHISEQLIFVS